MKIFYIVRKIFNNIYIRHIVYWSAAFLISAFLFSQLRPPVAYWNLSISIFLPIILPVYLNFLLIKRLIKQKRYIEYSISVSVLIVCFGIAAFFLHSFLFDSGEGIIGGMLRIAFIILLTTGIKYIKESMHQDALLKEAKIKQSEAELDQLRMQFNPHFLFNALNNLYGMAKKNNDEPTALGILKLSGLMRYLASETTADKLMLAKEIEHINNYIELQKMRFAEDDDIMIEFETENCENVFIPPMLLMPFIENAFKHGVSLREHSRIIINLRIQQNKLFFQIENTTHKNSMDSSGIGLINVKKRLQLLFPERHRLDITEAEGIFSVKLIIDMDEYLK